MATFKLYLTESDIEPKDVDPALLKRLEAKYGPVDMKNDFFDDDLETYFKTSDIDKETGKISHDIIKLASFGDALKKMSDAVKSLKQLMGTDDARNDQNIRDIASELKQVFNQYRTHLRKNYPDQYNQIKSQLEEISMSGGGAAGATFTPGTGEQYATPNAFSKNKKGKYSDGGMYTKKFGYKLVPDKIKDSGLEVKQLFKEANMYKYKLSEEAPKSDSVAQFHNKRMLGFDAVEDLLGQIKPLLDDAKAETEKYYKQNPKSYAVVYGTDLIQDYLKDIILILKNSEDENSTNTI